MARRQARAEAREIRMRELEKQQREQEENADRQFDMLTEPLTRVARTSGNRYLSSRRSSEDSLEDGGSIRDLRVSCYFTFKNFLFYTRQTEKYISLILSVI